MTIDFVDDTSDRALVALSVHLTTGTTIKFAVTPAIAGELLGKLRCRDLSVPEIVTLRSAAGIMAIDLSKVVSVNTEAQTQNASDRIVTALEKYCTDNV